MPARLYCFKQVMKKKYICRLSATNILVKIADKVKRLEFEPAVISNYGLRGCAYETDKEDVQKVVESHPQFRNGQRDSITIYGESFDKPLPVVEPQLQEENQEPVIKRARRAKKEE